MTIAANNKDINQTNFQNQGIQENKKIVKKTLLRILIEESSNFYVNMCGR